MTGECNGKLLQAYRLAISEGHDGIADLIEDVILEAMKGERTSPIVIGGSRTTVEPPWKVTCGPDIVQLNTTADWTGIDPMTKEVTS